jgi:hypothetical protein
MASLFLLKKITSHFKFRPVQTGPDIIISGISKIYLEHILLKSELCFIGIPLLTAACPNPNNICLFCSCAFITLYGSTFVVPVARTYQAYKSSTLQILDL